MSSPEDNKLLPLHQVLEEEYERLHNGSPPSLDKTAEPKERLAAIFKNIHQKKHTALCLSGGGIRSATFALGVLQGLARRNLLNKFHYLSTVSGGGYVGAWLSSWIHRHPGGMKGVIEDLNAKPKKKLEPEPEPIQHLRNYSNYLTPRPGIFSADTWTVVAIVVRNLMLNWLVLVPMMVVVLIIPRLCVANIRNPLNGSVTLAFLIIGFVLGVISITYAGIKRPSSTSDSTGQKEFLMWCLLPLLLSAVMLTTFWAWCRNTDMDVIPFIIFGLLQYLIAWLGRFSFWKLKRRGRFVEFKVKEFFATLFSGAIGGVFLWLVATKVFSDPISGTYPDLKLYYVSFASPLYLALFLLTAILFAGFSSEFTVDEDREWWARFSAWVLIAITVWSAVSYLVLLGPQLFNYAWGKYVVPAGGLIGFLTAKLAQSARSPANAKQEQKSGWRGVLMSYMLPLGALLFIALLIVLLSFGTNYLLAILTLIFRSLSLEKIMGDYWLLAGDSMPPEGDLHPLNHITIIRYAPFLLLVVLAVIIVVLAYWLSRLIDTNTFSYHAMYRNRLIRAYLGASNMYRFPNLFTGFDSTDNIPMYELRPEFFHPGSFKDIKEDNKDIRGFVNFVKRLKVGENELSIFFRNRLSTATIKFLDEYNENRPPSRVLQRALIADLNGKKFVQKPDTLFDDSSAFSEEMLTDKAKKLLANHKKKSLEGDQLILFNRRLIESAFPEDIHECLEPPHKLLHVVNMALNLVHGKNLAWQDRKAASFTVSPLHSGSCQIHDFEDEDKKLPIYGSYRQSKEYGGKDDDGISLGTAVAISGAAVSPNMGYYSSPLVTFLMTLFNVRLGWWLGNPGKAGSDCYRLANPKYSAYPIVAEAFGLTDDKNSYVYLSDGGHFENLGLYEMVLRRCHTIVVCDASDDFEFKFDSLGNAIRKIRVDFGIPIEFEPMFIYPRSKNKPGAFCAVGHIKYSEVDDKVDRGTLIYIKPVFYEDDEPPRDIYHYAQANKRFPHESTVDLWFSEEQFESYRSLGVYIMDKILEKKGKKSMNLDTFVSSAEEHVKNFQKKKG